MDALSLFHVDPEVVQLLQDMSPKTYALWEPALFPILLALIGRRVACGRAVEGTLKFCRYLHRFPLQGKAIG